MIFSPPLAAKVLRGEKTETRRPLRDGRPTRYEVDRIYAVQPGRGKQHIGHIQVLWIGEEPLRAITEHSARHEGFGSRGDFMAYWLRLHGSWNPEEMVAVIDFRRADDCPRCQKE